jgi:hypothetical protein
VPVVAVQPFEGAAESLWRTANEYYRQHLQGKAVQNPAMGEVRFSKEGRSKARHVGRQDPRRVSLVQGLARLVEVAVPVEEAPDAKGRPDIGRYVYAVAPVEIGGGIYAVRLVLREETATGGRRFYTFAGYKLEPSAIDRGDAAEAPLPVRGSLGSLISVPQPLKTFKTLHGQIPAYL